MLQALRFLLFGLLVVFAALPAAAQVALGPSSGPCITTGPYPYEAGSCLTAPGLNSDLDLSPGGAPPTNVYGRGAGYGKPWLDTSVSPPRIRICAVPSPGLCSTTYVASQWYDLGAVDQTSGTIDLTAGGGVVSVPSSGVVDLGLYPQGLIQITGTSTINSFGASLLPGKYKILIFTSTLTITNSTNAIAIPGGNNITTQMGGMALATAQGNGIVSLIYQPQPTGGLSPIANNTVLGNITGGSAMPGQLTSAQLTTLCNIFTSTLSGCVPAGGGGSLTFLGNDAAYHSVPGAVPIANNTVLGNVSGAAATPTALTAAQLTALCNTFSSILSGCVPSPGAGNLRFLGSNASYYPLDLVAPTNSALTALSTTGFTSGVTTLRRAGFAAAGDGGAAHYVYSSSACSSSDNGAQVTASGGGCWIADLSGPGVDDRVWGATCGSSDSTTAIQNAINATQVNGGVLIVPCPQTIASSVTIATGAIRMRGAGPGNGYPGQITTPGPSIWPPTKGSAINCTGTSGSGCIIINGAQGVEIDHILFGNPQPLPPACPGTGPCNNYTPTSYPYVIDTVQDSGWQSLNIHDASCTSCSRFIDLEGTSAYTLFTGTESILSHLWCNSCLNVGIRLHLIDNPLLIDHIDYVGQWNGNLPSLGYYERQNLIELDIQYAAAPQFANLNFWVGKAAISLENGTVTNGTGGGPLTFAISAGQFTNIMFNNACQSIILPNGNGTFTSGQIAFNNVYVWGDQSGFNCSSGKALFDLPSNYINISFHNLGVAVADTFANIGCGVPGTGSCPSGQPNTGGSIMRISDLDVLSYSSFSSGQPFIKAPSNAQVAFEGSFINEVRPNTGAGNIMAPGLDGSQGYMAPVCVGGGPLALEGAGCLTGSGPGANSGGVNFYSVGNISPMGFVGATTSAGINLKSNTGKVFLDSVNGAGSAIAQFGATTGSQNLINLTPAPTSPPSGTAGTRACFDSVGNLYAAAC